jgi:hypothetical protein
MSNLVRVSGIRRGFPRSLLAAACLTSAVLAALPWPAWPRPAAVYLAVLYSCSAVAAMALGGRRT